jgi:hypothetical protein
LQLFLDFLLCQFVLGKLPLNRSFDVVVLSVSSYGQINNEISLQPACAIEALHFYSIIQQAFVACPSLLVSFFTVHTHYVLVDSDKAACLALQPVQRCPKLFYRPRRLVWKRNLCRVN